tara:strand:+ start:840 stop:1289 length:450 start_codon:yes stop_codon:yes gene_type:complete
MYMRFSTKYIPKSLTETDKRKQRAELIKSRKAYRRGEFISRKRIKSFKSKKSKHVSNAKILYKVKNLTINNKLANKTGCSKKSLRKIMMKGRGAFFSSGSRPNQTPHSWAFARLGSSITGGKSSAIDFDILKRGCGAKSLALKLAQKRV